MVERAERHVYHVRLIGLFSKKVVLYFGVQKIQHAKTGRLQYIVDAS